MKTFLKSRVIIIASSIILLAGVFLFAYHFKNWTSQTSVKSDLDDHEKTTLHFIHWSEFPKQIFSEFTKKNPNVQVEFERYGLDQYQNVQKTRIASGENIDLMGVVENDYKKFIDKGYLTDLTNEEFIKNYEPDVIDALSKLDSKNRIYGVSYKSEIYGIWYNKILFDKYFLRVPENFNEFINACSILKANGVNPMVIGGKEEPAIGLIYFLRLYKGSWNDKDWLEDLKTGEIKWTDKRIESSLKDIDYFLKSGFLLEESANITQQQAFYKFLNCQAAMCLISNWSLDMIEPGVDTVFDLGVFPIPYNDKGEPQFIPGTKTGLILGIYSGSRNKSGSKLLMDFLSQTDTAQYYSDITKSKTTIKGVNYEKLKYSKLWEPLKNSELIPTLDLAVDSVVQSTLNRNARELLMGTKKLELIASELQDVQEEVNLKSVKTPKKN